MKICVFGATGGTGRLLVEQALAAGHSVLAPVRDKKKLESRSEDLTVFRADVMDPQSLETLGDHAAPDHVVITLGSKKLWGDTVRSEGTANIVAALKASGQSPRLWVISAAGVQDSWDHLGLSSRFFARLLLPAVMREHLDQERTVQSCGLPYTLLRPTGLVDGDGEGGHVVHESGRLKTTSIERAAVARCVVENLENTAWVGRALTLTRP